MCNILYKTFWNFVNSVTRRDCERIQRLKNIYRKKIVRQFFLPNICLRLIFQITFKLTLDFRLL